MKAYKKLEKIFNEIGLIYQIQRMLFWDSATMMPINSANARGEQLAYLSKKAHKKTISPKVNDLIHEALNDQANLNEWQRANLRLMKRNIDNASALSSDLVEALEICSNQCEVKWREARAKSDFNIVKKELAEMVNLTRQKAIDLSDKFKQNPYQCLIDAFDPARELSEIDTYFNELAEFLPSLVDKIIAKQVKKPTDSRTYFRKIQMRIGKKYLTKLHFDFTAGRLDESTHPFCGGIPEDCRITTRYDKNNFISSFLGIVHEGGHSLYERNLPKKWNLQPVGYANGMAIHESQSLFVEKQICKSKPFLKYFYKDVINEFALSKAEYDFEHFNNQISFVERSFIRVDADEVTYPLHIIMRYNIEKALISGELSVEDLPHAFNKEMGKLLNINPASDAMGCLQDIHWYSGNFGYFPSYTIGAMNAAQIMAKIKKDMKNVDQLLENCELTPILEWLNNNIHSHGSKYSPNELIKVATGEKLNAKYFIDHLKTRYL